MIAENNKQVASNRRRKKTQSGLRSESAENRPRNQNSISNNIYGAIDLGTNNCRLLVAQQTPDGFKVLDSFSRIVRLGEGLGKNGILSQEAIERSLDALEICVAKTRRRGVTHLRNVATQACREAKNCDEFIERVEKEVRIKLHIIDPAEEARFAVLGCKALLDKRYGKALVFDIGGGSTELIWVKIGQNGSPEIIDLTSIPYGVVNMSEKYGTRDTLSEAAYAEMRQTITDAIKPFEMKNSLKDELEQDKVQLLGTSGTITTLTSMLLELDTYDRNKVDGTWVKSSHIYDLCQKLSRLNYEERVALKSIGRDRADLVVAGCAILESIMSLWPIKEIRVADRGIREGMLLDMMEENAILRNKNRRKNNKRRRNKLNNKSKSNGNFTKDHKVKETIR